MYFQKKKTQIGFQETVHCDHIQYTHLTPLSPEFDAAYDVISQDIPQEYLETRDFLRNRLRIRDDGPKSDQERLLVQDGYTIHLIAAMRDKQVIGAIYGHLISRITSGNWSAGFVTYISVHRDYRRRGIGTRLISALNRMVENDAIRMTGKSIFGMVYEIEEEGKEEIKATVKKLGARPLDIVYYQPALRLGYNPVQMNLWFQPVPPLASEQIMQFTLQTDIVKGLIRNMLVMEYVGPELKGFDLNSKSYSAFLESIKGKNAIGFLNESNVTITSKPLANAGFS